MKTAGTACFRLSLQGRSYIYSEDSYLLFSVETRSLRLWQHFEVGYVDFHARVNDRGKRKLRGEIYEPSKKQMPDGKLGLPTMLKAYLLPSLGPSSLFSRVIASFYNRGEWLWKACQRTTCNGARMRKHFSTRKSVEKFLFLSSRGPDYQVQKQLYLQN